MQEKHEYNAKTTYESLCPDMDKFPMVIKNKSRKIVFCNDVALRKIIGDEQKLAEIRQRLAESETDLNYHETILSYIGSSYKKILKTDATVECTKAPSINRIRVNLLDEPINLVVTKKMTLEKESKMISTLYRLTDRPISMEGNKIIIHDYFYPVVLSEIQYVYLVCKSMGLTNAQAAKRVYRTESHMRTMTQKLFELFNVYDYFTLTRYAQLSGWIDNKIIAKVF